MCMGFSCMHLQPYSYRYNSIMTSMPPVSSIPQLLLCVHSVYRIMIARAHYNNISSPPHWYVQNNIGCRFLTPPPMSVCTMCTMKEQNSLLIITSTQVLYYNQLQRGSPYYPHGTFNNIHILLTLYEYRILNREMFTTKFM